MKVPTKFISALFVTACLSVQSASSFAAETPKIAFSTKFGGVDFLFTEGVDRSAKADGNDFQFAIREVGFELISAVGKAAKATPGLDAILIDRIKFKDSKALVVLGIIAGGKFTSLNYKGTAPNSAVEKFAAGLEENRVTSLRVADGVGIELFLQQK